MSSLTFVLNPICLFVQPRSFLVQLISRSIAREEPLLKINTNVSESDRWDHQLGLTFIAHPIRSIKPPQQIRRRLISNDIWPEQCASNVLGSTSNCPCTSSTLIQSVSLVSRQSACNDLEVIKDRLIVVPTCENNGTTIDCCLSSWKCCGRESASR